MIGLVEKISYLRGLAEGLGIQDDTKEGKLLIHVIDLLDDIVDALSELETSQAELDEYVETLDEDLADLEEEVYGDLDEDDEDDEDARFIEVECPHCQETVFFDEDLFEDDEDIVCPNCSKTIYSEEEPETIDE